MLCQNKKHGKLHVFFLLPSMPSSTYTQNGHLYTKYTQPAWKRAQKLLGKLEFTWKKPKAIFNKHSTEGAKVKWRGLTIKIKDLLNKVLLRGAIQRWVSFTRHILLHCKWLEFRVFDVLLTGLRIIGTVYQRWQCADEISKGEKVHEAKIDGNLLFESCWGPVSQTRAVLV